MLDRQVGGIVQEVARAVAIQLDGKIVVVGDTRVGAGPFAFALVRYNADGSLDTSFGSGGKVVNSVAGRAFTVAIQPADGKIVVAGDDTVIEDFRLARYNANGSLDASFGSGGTLTTDIAGGSEVARNIVLQPNGAIVVSGDPFGSNSGTGVARYTANGGPDGSFGVGGKLTLAGARVGEGLALQSDRKLVLGGFARNNVDGYALARVNP